MKFRKIMAGVLSFLLLAAFSVPEVFAEGIDWEQETIGIGDAGTLQAFLREVNKGNTFEGQTLRLTADIDMAGKDWEMAGDLIPQLITPGDGEFFFDGTFDGNGHAIKNLTKEVVPGDGNNLNLLALFGSVGENGVIKNLDMVDVSLTGVASVAPIAAFNQGTISGCRLIGGKLVSDELHDEKYPSVFVESTGGVGGICGINTGTVENCSSEGAVLERGGANLGGICCMNMGIVSDCVSADCTYQPRLTKYRTNWTSSGSIGGIVGYEISIPTGDSAQVVRCVNHSDICGGRSVGGVCGTLENAVIEQCENDGNVTFVEPVPGGGQWLGGICGYAQLTSRRHDTVISGSVNYGNISGVDSVGGIIGRANYMGGLSQEALTASPTPSSEEKLPLYGDYAAGPNGGSGNGMVLEYCLNHGTISSSDNLAGGIVGKCDMAVTGCFNTGDVILSGEATGVQKVYYIGGIAGISNQSMEQCGNSGNVLFRKTTENVNAALIGGVLGNAYGSRLDDSYSIGSVRNEGTWPQENLFLGGVVGAANPETVANLYFSEDDPTEALVVNGFDRGSGAGLPAQSMRSLKAQETMPGLFGEDTLFTAAADFEVDGKIYSTSPFIVGAGMDRTTIAVEIGTAEPEPEGPEKPEPEEPDEPTGPDVPPTGDRQNVGMWSLLLLVSAAGVVLLLRTRRKDLSETR